MIRINTSLKQLSEHHKKLKLNIITTINVGFIARLLC